MKRYGIDNAPKLQQALETQIATTYILPAGVYSSIWYNNTIDSICDTYVRDHEDRHMIGASKYPSSFVGCAGIRNFYCNFSIIFAYKAKCRQNFYAKLLLRLSQNIYKKAKCGHDWKRVYLLNKNKIIIIFLIFLSFCIKYRKKLKYLN